jgi:hypothetical protein
MGIIIPLSFFNILSINPRLLLYIKGALSKYCTVEGTESPLSSTRT